jgi:cholinesterase
MYSYAWVEDPIVSGFIPQSGTVGLSSTGSPKSTAAKAGAPVEQANKVPQAINSWHKATSKLGCGDAKTNAASNLECMKGKKWQDVLAALNTAGGASSSSSMSFGPTADGKVVFRDYAARIREGKMIKKPMLVGNNKNEAGLFAVMSNSTAMSVAPLGIINSAAFGCPSSSAAKIRANNNVKAWRYLYSGECK